MRLAILSTLILSLSFGSATMAATVSTHSLVVADIAVGDLLAGEATVKRRYCPVGGDCTLDNMIKTCNNNPQCANVICWRNKQPFERPCPIYGF